jgi:osmotically-inducible protein OsmY
VRLHPAKGEAARRETTLAARHFAGAVFVQEPEELMKKTDSEIQQAVLQELKWDTRVEETDVGVEVDAGVVTLTGTVSSWGKRTAAQEAAHRVAGVLDVANDIQVKMPGSAGRTDTDIAGAVRHALEWDVFVPETRIRSTVSDGRVTLEGEVDYWNQRDDAEKAVRNLTGVRGVSNKIEIKPPKVIPYDVRKSIQDALERQAEREALRIKLEVQDGRVTLSGIVHSWAEKEAVIGAVKGTHGVRNVDDRLRIEAYAA